MTATLASARPEAVPGRAALVPLAVREMRRFAHNPVFLSGVAMAARWAWAVPRADPEIDELTGYPAIFLGALGMAAAYWLTRSMDASEPVAGVTPVTWPARTTALCGVAIVPLLCGVLTLVMFLRVYPVGDAVYGPFSPSARIAVLVGQIVIPRLAARCSGSRWAAGAVPGRRVRAVPGHLRLGGAGDDPDPLHQDSAPVAVLRLFSLFAFFTLHADSGGVTAWRGSPWFFIGWQLALCAIAVLVALLRGAEGRVRTRIVSALAIAGVAALILLMLAVLGEFTHAVTA